ncbi:MAG: hypothetical protein PHD31_00185 [Candidatus Pacebacteria bacterium]|nr:hypothetical protein [Candidatus Paceibacterota bacterium]
MFWIIATILSYFFYSLASLGDKIILAGPAKPKEYTFTVGLFSILVVLMIPFVSFGFPNGIQWLWIVLEGIVYVLGLYCLFAALDRFDVSRVVPTIGASQPIFIFILTCLFWGIQVLKTNEVLAFVMLLIGSVVVSMDKDSDISKDFVKLSFIASILFSLDFIFSKLIFLEMPFWQGFIWMRIVSFLFVIVFLFNKKFRKEYFNSNSGGLGKNNVFLFVTTQASGGLAMLLQSWAIALAPVAYLAIMNSMRGFQYVFLFIMTIFISYLFPKILKEETSKNVVFQKIIAILIICTGLFVFSM